MSIDNEVIQFIFVISKDCKEQLKDEWAEISAEKVAFRAQRYLKRLVGQIYGEEMDNIQINYVNINKPTDYKTKEVRDKILGFHDEANPKWSFVIYCYNTDSMGHSDDKAAFFEGLRKEIGNYDGKIVWFSPNLEYAFIGADIDENEKEEVARKFYLSQEKYSVETLNRLDSSDDYSTSKPGTSNILKILREIKSFDESKLIK